MPKPHQTQDAFAEAFPFACDANLYYPLDKSIVTFLKSPLGSTSSWQLSPMHSNTPSHTPQAITLSVVTLPHS